MTTNQIGSLNTKKLNSVMPDISNIADFNPEIQKKFSYGFMINTEKTNEGRPKNSLFWTGLLNTFFWIDLENKLGASIFMQTKPYFSKESEEIFKNWLWEKDSNLHALRHTRNNRACLPIPPPQKNFYSAASGSAF